MIATTSTRKTAAPPFPRRLRDEAGKIGQSQQEKERRRPFTEEAGQHHHRDPGNEGYHRCADRFSKRHRSRTAEQELCCKERTEERHDRPRIHSDREADRDRERDAQALAFLLLDRDSPVS
ncbi:hypothetical protein ACVJBD_000844 [Rhizobium mongolense]